MAFLFSRAKPNSTSGLVQTAKSQLEQILERQPGVQPPVGSERQIPPSNLAKCMHQKDDPASKTLGTLKAIIQGSYDDEPKPERVSDLINNMISADLFYLIVRSVPFLNFTGRKDAQTILSYAFRFRPPNSVSDDTPALNYAVNQRPEIIIELCRGYENKESSTSCGSVLREILKNDTVTAIILYDQSRANEAAIKASEIDLDEKQNGDGVFWKFFEWIDRSAFEVSADAFTTFRDLLTKHKQLTSHYLHLNFDLFFDRYHRILINSNSYVTKRQSIKLLGEILLDRANYNVMTAYVDQGAHLKISMNLLRDDRKMVQYEGFHVFKVFVANPNKSEAVTKILRQNRERLLNFLPNFLEDRTEDDQFLDEKAFLIRSIDNLPTMATGNTPGASQASAKAPAAS